MEKNTSQPTDILAKRVELPSPDISAAQYQTLSGHITDCLDVLRGELTLRRHVLKHTCTQNGIDFSDFAKSLFITIYLHDVGKGIKQFQENIRRGTHSPTYPHAFFALPILFRFFKNNPEFLLVRDAGNGDVIPIEALSILAHHTQLYDNMYKSISTEPIYLTNQINDFLSQLGRVYEELSFREFFALPRIEPLLLEGKMHIYTDDNFPLYTQIVQFIGKMRDACGGVNDEISRKIKLLYSINNSILKTCDAFASRRFDELIRTQRIERRDNPHGHVSFSNEYNDLFKEIAIKETALLPKEGWRKFQEQLVNCSARYVILRAPCGRGKTRPALAWARSVAERYNKDRIIFAMPTQVTSNAMSNTLKNFCKANTVGLFHGRSFIYLKKSAELEETLGTEEIKELSRQTYESSIFHTPMVVTTLDHIIYSMIHGYSKADQALGNLLNSVIVFDEAHYYDFTGMQSFLNLLRILRRYEVPHIVMSGTLPAFFVEALNENREYLMIEDNEGASFKPFYLIRMNSMLVRQGEANTEIIEEVVQRFLHGENGIAIRQTVVLNTVARAQVFYMALKERLLELGKASDLNNIRLYHSQFTFAHRTRIENSILKQREERPFVLVGTQVIEVSLDISSDIMYSEVAPIDAIGQRAGRLNRGGKRPESNGVKQILYLFEPESSAPYGRDDETNILSQSSRLLTDGVYSYQRISELCNILYQNVELVYDPVFETLFKEGILFGRPYWSIADDDETGRQGFKFRREETPTLFVIPECVYAGNERNLATENEVRIPLYKVMKIEGSFYTSPTKSKDYIICRFPSYDAEIGFNDLLEPSTERMGSNLI